jgi:hypothetical protein
MLPARQSLRPTPTHISDFGQTQVNEQTFLFV